MQKCRTTAPGHKADEPQADQKPLLTLEREEKDLPSPRLRSLSLLNVVRATSLWRSEVDLIENKILKVRPKLLA